MTEIRVGERAEVTMHRGGVSAGTLGALLAVFAFIACAGCAADPPRHATASAAPAPDILQNALLSVDDLPDGWAAHDPLRASGTPRPPRLLATLDAPRVGVNPYLAQTVDVYEPGGGHAAMAALRALFTPNTTFAMTFPAGNGGTRSMRVYFWKLPSPKLGEESFSVWFDTADGGKGAFVAIRRGDAITMLRHYTAGTTGGAVEGWLTRQLAERADERLARLVTGR